MMKFVVLVLLFGCHSATADVHNIKSSLEPLASDTVALVIPGGHSPYCTATWISRDRLLTAAHCMSVPVELMTRTGSIFVNKIGLNVGYALENEMDALGVPAKVMHPAFIEALDDDTDLALLHVVSPIPHHNIATLGHVPKQGDVVSVMCHKMGAYWTYMRGDVSVVDRHFANFTEDGRRLTDRGPYIQVDISLGPGCSGGALFDEQAHIVGVAAFIRTDTSDMSFFIHTQSVSKFLSKAKFR